MKSPFFHLIIFFCLFSACKKSNENPTDNKPDCRVTELRTRSGSGNDTNTYRYQYDNQGRLSSIVSGNSTTTYTYTQNTIVANFQPINGNFQIDTIVYANLLVSYIGSNAFNGYYKTVFDYDANGYVIKSDVMNKPYILDHYYTWQNGDLIVDSANNDSGTQPIVNRYEYYTDKYSQYTGDQRIGGFMSFFPSPNNSVHLLKSGSNGMQIYYSHNSENQIVSDSTVFASGPKFYRSYSYTCN